MWMGEECKGAWLYSAGMKRCGGESVSDCRCQNGRLVPHENQRECGGLRSWILVRVAQRQRTMDDRD